MNRAERLTALLRVLQRSSAAGALRGMVREAGWAGALGIGLMVLAVAGGTVARQGFEHERSRLAAERTRLTQGAVAANTDRRSDRERLAAYYAARFPGESRVAERLGVLYARAGEHGIAIRRVDYRSAREPGTPLQRIALVLPVQGEFARIHGWLSAVLVDMPELGLEALSIKRSGSELSTLEAELRLMLFVEAGR